MERTERPLMNDSFYLIVSTRDDLRHPVFHSWNDAGRP
jgi:hypothetical protein